jgi:hypothetical protein
MVKDGKKARTEDYAKILFGLGIFFDRSLGIFGQEVILPE